MKWTSCRFLSCNLVIKCQLFFDIVIILPDILVDVYSENGAVLTWGFSVSLRLQSVCVLVSGSLKRQRIRQSAPGTGGEIIRAVLRWDFCEVTKLREKYYCEIKRYLLLLTRPDLRAQKCILIWIYVGGKKDMNKICMYKIIYTESKPTRHNEEKLVCSL